MMFQSKPFKIQNLQQIVFDANIIITQDMPPNTYHHPMMFRETNTEKIIGPITDLIKILFTNVKSSLSVIFFTLR